ncbi:GNAT family N-acetyltransferase [Desulfocurvus sp. DL9XJH121]
MKDTDILLRTEVRDADAAVVEAMSRATGLFTEAEVDIAVELVDEHLAHGRESGYYFLFAEDRKGCAGYACYGPSVDEPGWFDLYWIVVEPERQGRGVGSLLLTEVERRVAGEHGLGLVAETSGQALYRPTRGFYEARGFLARRRVKDHYSPGDDMVVYLKPLPTESAPVQRGS